MSEERPLRPQGDPPAEVPRQRTIRRPVDLAGIGLHTGRPVRVRLGPAPPHTGIRFRRVDLPGAPEVRADLAAVQATARGVTLGAAPEATVATVATVEHLLSAAAGLDVDNLLCEVDGPELPALDGSARGFVEALRAAEPVEQEASAAVIEVGEATVAHGAGVARSAPGPALEVTYVVDLPAPLGRQVARYGPGVSYAEAIAPARTWGFAEEAAALRARGLAHGASPDNVLVLGPEGYLTPPRFPDEPARHKLLDLLGDLALLGARLRGRIAVERGGHALHLALARAIARREAGPIADGAGGVA